jgi:hypothetical protein
LGCLKVSGGPAHLPRASRHDLGCLEVSGGPAHLPRHDLGSRGPLTKKGIG